VARNVRLAPLVELGKLGLYAIYEPAMGIACADTQAVSRDLCFQSPSFAESSIAEAEISFRHPHCAPLKWGISAVAS
jgi:hypothetical protein